MKGYKRSLIRHGVTQGNLDGKYIGITDLPLCEQGIKELYDKRAKYEYPGVQKVYVSPLRRCIQTADILYPGAYTAKLGLLAEMDLGEFEGQTAESLSQRADYIEWLKGGADNAPPGGESPAQVMSRCYEALNIIISDMMYEGFTSCAVVTHGGIIMNMLSGFGLPKLSPADLGCDFGEGFEVSVSAAMWQRSEAFEILGRLPDWK